MENKACNIVVTPMCLLLNGSFHAPAPSAPIQRSTTSTDAFNEFGNTVYKYPVFITATFGILANIVNMIVFVSQGFKESVNISLTTLVFWDLVKCICASLINIRWYLPIYTSLTASEYNAYLYAKGSYVQMVANYISFPIAAYLAIERAFCVAAPFKVKSIFTPKLTALLMSVISISIFSTLLFLFFLYDVGHKVEPVSNLTLAYYYGSDVSKRHGAELMDFYNLFGIVVPVASLVICSVCTFIISYHLQRASSFRTKAQNEAKSTPKMSARDRKVVKMLLVVIGMFIFNLVPRTALQIAKLVEPEFYHLRAYSSLFRLTGSLVFFFDVVNGSTNFFIFIIMSSQFQANFKKIFLFQKQQLRH